MVMVKSEYSFTFDSSICLRDFDMDLPHFSQLYVLGLVIVFNVIKIGFHLCIIHWIYELYKISLSHFLRKNYFQQM